MTVAVSAKLKHLVPLSLEIECSSSLLSDNFVIGTGLMSGIGMALLATIVALLLYRHHRRIKEAQERLAKEFEDILNANGGKTAKLFTGKEIKKATGNFSKDRLLGVGSYGEVYRGILDDGTVVAIKCVKLGNTKGTDQTSQKAIDFNQAADDVNLAVYVQRTVEEERIMDVVGSMLKEKASTVMWRP
ncbi:hypothetical protein NL676_037100 [Syzygium grande]|nr:hypothetical protein NL676_037100 [Syzygium grande]